MKIKHLLSTLVASALLSFAAQADEIQLTLAADAVGTTQEMAFTAELPVTLEWGNGTTETLNATGLPQNVAIKHTALSIKTSGTGDLTQLFAPACGVTTVTFSATTGLEVIDLSDNQITKLTLTKAMVPALRELYMRNNKLEKNLIFNAITTLEVIDLANNNITSFIAPAGSASRLRSLVLSGNKLTSVSYGASAQINTIWVNDNAIKSVSLSSLPSLTYFVASGNAITSVSIADSSKLQQLWLDENKLTSLDISKTLGLVTLSVEDNGLTEINYPSSSSNLTKLLNFYARGNALAPSFIPNYAPFGKVLSVYSIQVGEQTPIPMGFKQVDPNVVIDITKFCRNIQMGIKPTFKVMSSTGVTIDPSKYTLDDKTYKLTFKEDVGAVYLSATGERAPEAVFNSAWFDVGAVTAINMASKDKAALSIAVQTGAMVLSVASPVAVQVYGVSGAKVYDAIVQKTTTINLPAGVYIVNGQKILVP